MTALMRIALLKFNFAGAKSSIAFFINWIFKTGEQSWLGVKRRL